MLFERIVKSVHAKTNPNGKNIKRAHDRIVAFSRFKRFGVGVKDNRQARKGKKQKQGVKIVGITFELKDQSCQSQKERKEVIGISRLVVFHFFGQIVLRPQPGLIDNRNVTQPVAVLNVQIPLHIVLAPHEIPQEVAAVHVAELVLNHKPKVLCKTWPLCTVGRDSCNGFVIVNGCGVGHSRNQAFVFVGIDRSGIFVLVYDHIGARFVVFFVFGFFVFKEGVSVSICLLFSVVADGVIGVVKYVGISILLPVVISEQLSCTRRVVFVDGRIGVGANWQHQPTRKSNHEKQDGQGQGVCPKELLFAGVLQPKIESNAQK